MIHTQPDCGNSPKQKFVEEVTRVILSGKLQELEAVLVSNYVIKDATGRVDSDLKEFSIALERSGFRRIKEAFIHHVVSHGRHGASSGTAELKDGELVGFAFFVRFGSAKGSSLGELTYHLPGRADHADGA